MEKGFAYIACKLAHVTLDYLNRWKACLCSVVYARAQIMETYKKKLSSMFKTFSILDVKREFPNDSNDDLLQYLRTLMEQGHLLQMQGEGGEALFRWNHEKEPQLKLHPQVKLEKVDYYLQKPILQQIVSAREYATIMKTYWDQWAGRTMLGWNYGYSSFIKATNKLLPEHLRQGDCSLHNFLNVDYWCEYLEECGFTFAHLYKAVNSAVPLYYYKIAMSDEKSFVVDDLKRYITSLEYLISIKL